MNRGLSILAQKSRSLGLGARKKRQFVRDSLAIHSVPFCQTIACPNLGIFLLQYALLLCYVNRDGWHLDDCFAFLCC